MIRAIYWISFILLVTLAWIIPLGGLALWAKIGLRLVLSMVALVVSFPLARLILRVAGRQGEVWRLTAILYARWHSGDNEPYAAADSLAAIGSPSAVGVLVKACRDTSVLPSARALGNSIGRIRSQAAVPSLVSVLLDKTNCSDARIGAIRAVGEIKDPRGVAPLQKMLDDGDVAFAAKDALAAMGYTLPPGRRIVDNDIHYCAENGDIWNVERLIRSNRDEIHACDPMQRTPIHRAAQGGQIAMIRLLLSKGANINACDRYGYTPLHLAAECDKAEAIRELLANGADVTAVADGAATALHQAATHNSVAAIEVLLEAAAPTLIPMRDSEMRLTAKEHASKLGCDGAVKAIERFE
jgi:hypothetical protein